MRHPVRQRKGARQLRTTLGQRVRVQRLTNLTLIFHRRFPFVQAVLVSQHHTLPLVQHHSRSQAKQELTERGHIVDKGNLEARLSFTSNVSCA